MGSSASSLADSDSLSGSLADLRITQGISGLSTSRLDRQSGESPSAAAQRKSGRANSQTGIPICLRCLLASPPDSGTRDHRVNKSDLAPCSEAKPSGPITDSDRVKSVVKRSVVILPRGLKVRTGSLRGAGSCPTEGTREWMNQLPTDGRRGPEHRGEQGHHQGGSTGVSYTYCPQSFCKAKYSGPRRYQKLASHISLHNTSDSFACALCHHLLPTRLSLVKHLEFEHNYRGLPRNFLEGQRVNRSFPISDTEAEDQRLAVKRFLKTELAIRERENERVGEEVKSKLRALRQRFEVEAARRKAVKKEDTAEPEATESNWDPKFKEAIEAKEEHEANLRRCRLQRQWREHLQTQAEHREREEKRRKESLLRKVLNNSPPPPPPGVDTVDTEDSKKGIKVYPEVPEPERSPKPDTAPTAPPFPPVLPPLPSAQVVPDIWRRASQEEQAYLLRARRYYWASVYKSPEPEVE